MKSKWIQLDFQGESTLASWYSRLSPPYILENTFMASSINPPIFTIYLYKQAGCNCFELKALLCSPNDEFGNLAPPKAAQQERTQMSVNSVGLID